MRGIHRTFALCACALMALTQSPTADAASPEEEAALLLFKEGRTAFGAGEYAEALGHFEEASKVVNNVYVQYYIARTWVALDRCAEAIPKLAELQGQLPPEAEGPRREDERRCLLKEARAHVKATRCGEALPLLKRLEGMTTGIDEEWRASRVPWCEARITDFLTDTPSRKAAYKLYLAGKQAMEGGDPEQAIHFFRKTAALVDEKVVRESLAWALVETGADCPQLVTALNGAEGPPSEPHALQVACETYGPGGQLAAAERRAYLGAVVAGLEARRRQDLATASERLSAAADQHGNPALKALTVDVLHEQERCDDYIAAVETADDEVRPLITSAESRLASCAAKKEDTATTAPSEAEGGDSTLSWVLMGTGGGALVTGAIVLAMRQGDLSAKEDAEAKYNAGVDTVASLEAAKQAQADADGKSTLGAALVAGGVGMATVGLIFMLMDEPEGAAEEEASQGGVQLAPFLTTRAVGLQGRF